MPKTQRKPSSAEQARMAAKRAVVTNVADIPEGIREKKYANAPEVGIAIKVISISHLDLADNTFMADFNINVAWKGEKSWPGEDKESMAELVQIYNMMEGEDPDLSDVKKGEAGFDWYIRIRYKGKFRQHYYLQKFPFDEQNLVVRVRLKNECRLVALPWGPSGDACSIDPGALEDDFSLEKAHVEHEYHPSYKFGKLGGYDPEALIVFRVQRKPDYWIYNYGVMISLICTFSFAAFCISVGDVGGRLGVGFTLNLTAVASFYLMQDKLPAVPYWTELDRHMVTCILFTMVVMILNCLPAFFGEDFVGVVEKFIIIPVMAVAWFGYHAWQMAHIKFLLKRTDEDTDAYGMKKED